MLGDFNIFYEDCENFYFFEEPVPPPAIDHYTDAAGAYIQHWGDHSLHRDVDPFNGLAPAPLPAPMPPLRVMQQPEVYAYIVEQPAPQSLRFRYESEGRATGSILGINHTPEHPTFPSIMVVGYRGSMIVEVSCVTKDKPYKPHPHKLVGHDCCMGVCRMKVRTEGDGVSVVVPFRNLGVHRVKYRDIVEALRLRKTLNVNPFNTSFSHRNEPRNINLKTFRLAFQVLLTDDAFNVQRVLPSLASDVVYDKKDINELVIVRSSHCSGPARGGTTVILLCEKVNAVDTEVCFFREESDGSIWSELVAPELVHRQLALVFKTPPYRDPNMQQHVSVNIQLRRKSDGAVSNVYSFEYIPDHQDMDFMKRKRKMKSMSYDLLMYDNSSSSICPTKTEPQERTPPHNMNTGSGGPLRRGEDGAGASWYPDPGYYASHQPNVAVTQIQQHMQMRSPQALSPNPQMMSPNSQMMSPNSQMMSPNPRVMSPNSQMMSPNPQSMPLGAVQQQNLQMGVATTVQQQNAAQQGHIMTNPQQQVAPLDDMPVNSGDIASLANLSSMIDRLGRLSTRDLLPDPK